jgi:hypothetical protein
VHNAHQELKKMTTMTHLALQNTQQMTYDEELKGIFEETILTITNLPLSPII